MRYFNTSGPCHPAEHYTVMRGALIEQGKQMVERGRYFTIFAPRQAGKTTCVQLLFERLKAEGAYLPIWVSFEHLKTYSAAHFYQDVGIQLGEELAEYGLQLPISIYESTGFGCRFKSRDPDSPAPGVSD